MSSGDSKTTFINTGDSETMEELRVEEATREQQDRASPCSALAPELVVGKE